VQTKEMTMIVLLLVPLLLLFAVASPFRWFFGGGLWGRPWHFHHHHGYRHFHGGHFHGRR
jgi:hypothetical protein